MIELHFPVVNKTFRCENEDCHFRVTTYQDGIVECPSCHWKYKVEGYRCDRIV
jgi:hypothetical protein